MQDKSKTEFDVNIHKSRKNGEPMKLRGLFVVDDDKLKAAKEVISKVDDVTSEFQLEDIPQTILDQAVNLGITLSVEEHMFRGKKKQHERFFSFLHPDSDNIRSFNRFASETMSKGDVGKSENDRGF